MLLSKCCWTLFFYHLNTSLPRVAPSLLLWAMTVKHLQSCWITLQDSFTLLLLLDAPPFAGCVMNEAKTVLSAVVLDRELCAAPPSKMLGRGMFLIEANLMLPSSTPGGPSCWTRDDSWMLLPVHSFIQAGQRGVISVCTPPLCWMLKLLVGPTLDVSWKRE
ncbi:hypothetical protein VIGAN_08273500 [Vigna angularis var. angularis]|nr:hypothetical protein VIGAN_08273500 [Vigna angularis var. angularis]